MRAFDRFRNSCAVGDPARLRVPPGTPKNRLEVLRNAFNTTMTDGEFLAEMKKSKLEINPLSGAEVKVSSGNYFRRMAKRGENQGGAGAEKLILSA